MIFHRGLIKNQKGFTLIELLVALAITGLISIGITRGIFQVLNINVLTSNRVIAITEVENAGYWITRDAEMAQSIVTGTENLTLAWVWEYESAGNTYIDTYEVCYTYADSELRRDQTITTDKYDSSGDLVEPPDDPSHNSMLVAEHITAITPSMDVKKLTVSVTASIGEIEEQRTYEITPRPN